MECLNVGSILKVISILLSFIFVCHCASGPEIQRQPQCRIDEYYERDLQMCKPCTEVCRQGDRYCSKLCPCYVIQRTLEETRTKCAILQAETIELAASKKKWRAIAIIFIMLMSSVSVFGIMIGMLTIRIMKRNKQRLNTLQQQSEDDNEKSRLAPSGMAPPSPEPAIILDNQPIFSYGGQERVAAGQEEDRERHGDMEMQTWVKETM